VGEVLAPTIPQPTGNASPVKSTGPSGSPSSGNTVSMPVINGTRRTAVVAPFAVIRRQAASAGALVIDSITRPVCSSGPRVRSQANSASSIPPTRPKDVVFMNRATAW
jgi:hypothetical protein